MPDPDLEERVRAAEQRAEAAIELAQREAARMRYLAHAGELLASSMSAREILATLARLAVPELADWAAVDLFIEGGTAVDRVAIAHVDSNKVSLVQDLVKKYPPRLDRTDDGLGRILATGEPQLVPEIPEALLVHAARDEEHLRIIRELGLRSYVCVPIASRDRVRGAFTLISAESGRSYGEDDLQLALEIARRASIALDIADTVTELQRAERVATQADKRKDEFLALLGHELRNPLAAIAAASEVMAVSAAGSDRATQRAQQAIARQVGHMKHMLDDLLDVARIARGKMALVREPLDLREVVRHTVGDHRADFARSNVAVSCDLPATPVSVAADRTRLAQLIANLVLNAVKFTPAGGTVTLRVRSTDERAELEVADTGIGIDEQDLEDLFDPFVQARPTHERSKAGLGLGLALVKGLAELHGGSVHAHSEGEGRGARFVVHLPLTGAKPTTAVEAPAPAGEPLVVLVVEDDPDGGEMLSMLVSSLGHAVHLAENGPRALELAREHRPALVLCDIGLGGTMSGYDVARALRSATDVGRPFLVAVTGFGLPEHESRAREAGFDRYYTKPISRAGLAEAFALARRSAGG